MDLLECERTVPELAAPLQLHHDGIAYSRFVYERAQLVEAAYRYAIDGAAHVTRSTPAVARHGHYRCDENTVDGRLRPSRARVAW